MSKVCILNTGVCVQLELFSKICDLCDTYNILEFELIFLSTSRCVFWVWHAKQEMLTPRTTVLTFFWRLTLLHGLDLFWQILSLSLGLYETWLLDFRVCFFLECITWLTCTNVHGTTVRRQRKNVWGSDWTCVSGIQSIPACHMSQLKILEKVCLVQGVAQR